MTRPVHALSMYGWGGFTTDPGEAGFTARVHSETGANIHASPYLSQQCNQLATIIDGLPPDAIIFVIGTSLGACNGPAVGARTKRKIYGLFGFQASIYGLWQPITRNVLFAHLFYSYNPMPFPGLGAQKWSVAPGNTVTGLHLTPRHIPHPGDYDKPSQDTFLAEMKRIIAAPGD